MSKLQAMTTQIVDVFTRYSKQGTKPWNYRVAAHDLQYQVGNLSKAILQLDGFRFKGDKSEGEVKEVIADELADIMAEVLFIAAELDIDIEQARK